MGGVASFHANLLERYAPGNLLGIEVSAVFSGNLGAKGPFHPLLANIGLSRAEEEAAFTAAARRADAAFIFHVAHRFGAYWERNRDMPPLVARVPSWTGLGPDVPDKVAIVRRRLDRASAVVLACKQLLDEGVRCGYVSADRAHVIPSGLDSGFSAPVEWPRERPKKAVFVGRLDENKGVVPFLLALKQLPDWHATVVGAGELGDLVRKTCEEEGLTARVELCGGLSDRGVLRDIVASASVLCVPSRREAFGTVYAEAMAVGTFAVGLQLCIDEINEALSIQGGIGVHSQVPTHIALAIARAHELTTDRRLLSELARSRYSADRSAENLAAVLKAAARGM
jgi:glycosyltransferase involved in cell wall biosynthesis